MPEIRTRMTVDGAITGQQYGFLEPIYMDRGRAWNAVDADCPACQAPKGTRCGKSFCADRIQLVRSLAESGELEGEPILDRPKDCRDCRKRLNQTKTKWLACANPQHRCLSMDRGSRCSAAVVTGTDRCEKHSPMRPVKRMIPKRET